jgi:hypothetical protein
MERARLGLRCRVNNEETLGFNQTRWKDGKFGALNLMGWYSYVNRKPWATLDPSDAHINIVFLNLCSTLPGSAPTLGKQHNANSEWRACLEGGGSTLGVCR